MNKLVPKLLFLILSTLGLEAMAVQLSGTYTINPSLPASTTNFQNIRSAVTYMTSTGARADAGPANSGTVGVNGPVEFLIAIGTFNEQVNIPAITGASTTNTVTFRGAGRSTTILTFATADANNRHTLRLNLATNVTFRDMTIRGTGATHAWVVHVMGLNSNNNKFKNCLIEVSGTGSTSTSTNYIAVVLNNSATATTTGTRIDGTEIDSCDINNGYYGVLAAGAASNLHVGLKISNSRINNSYLYGIYATYANGINIHNNFILPRASYLYNYGIYILNSICTAPNRHIITNNKIVGFGYYGIYITGSSNLSGNKGLIANNMIGGLVKYDYSRCLFLNSTSQWRISHNTFNHDIGGQSNLYGAVYISGGSGNSFINNICYEKLGSPAIPLYASATSVFDTINYNLFYRPDTAVGGLIYIGSILNSGNFKGASGQNNNSIFGNPNFANDTTMLNTNACYQGMPLSYVSTDIFGTTRSTTNPIMGAYETPSIGNNLAVLNITNITPPITAGATDLSVLVRNNGNNTITSFNLSYRLNNGTPVVYPWTGTLAACDTVSITFTGTQQPTLGAVNQFKIYSSLPNAVNDSDATNDTIYPSYFLPLSGVYYIGGTNPDFAKPSDAFNALQNAGMTGPVRFEVRPGTYFDQVSIDKPILGLSTTNNVVMAGTSKDSCIIITNNANSSNRHTIRIGQSHIRLDSLTLVGNSSSFGWVVHINKNQTRNIQIKNCNILLTHPNAQSSSSDVYAGIVLSGSSNSLYYYDNFVLDSIEIDSNFINYGYAGIWQYSYFYNYYYTYGAPSEAIRMRNNTINNVYYAGINTNGTSSLFVNNNTVRFRIDTINTVYNYGIYISNHDASTLVTRSFQVNNNRVVNSNYMGMYITNIKAHSNNRGQFVNNAMNVGINLPNCYGLYFYSLTNTDVYHNSVLNNQASTSNSTGAFYFGQGSGMRIRNNHFVCSNPSTLGVPVYISGVSYTAANQFNHNNLYRRNLNGNFAYINAWYTGNSFIGASGSNINSITTNPRFYADTLLKSFSGCINGDTINYVNTDINGLQRNSPGDLGAYEIPTVTNDAGIYEITNPINPAQAGLQDLQVKIINYGNATLTSADVNYRLNTGTPVTQSWTGSLSTCDTTSVYFTGTQQINLASNILNRVKVYTSNPNAQLDSIATNDTLEAILATGLKGNYIIGPAPSDYLTINAAVNELSIRGVDSVVTFLIKTGTYNENFILPEITGASAAKSVTFKSLANHADSVIISRNNLTIGSNYIVRLNGAKFVNFERLTMSALNTTYGYVFDIGINAGFINVRNCKLNAPVVTTTSTNMSIVYGINNLGGNISFVNNVITGGAYGIYLRGTDQTNLTDNNVIDSNVITNQYYMGIYNYFNADQKIRNNNINTSSTYTVYYGIYAYYSDSAMEITGNRIFSTTANGYGINTYWCDGTITKPGLIANNVIRMGSGSSTANFGLRDQYSSQMLIANNTVVINTTSTTGYAGYFYYNGTISNTTRIINNIFSNISTGACLYHWNPTFGTSDFNLIHTNGTANFVQRGSPANTYTSLQAFRAAVTNQERNSLQYRPAFISGTNLTPNPADTAVWAINGRGIQLPEVSTDYNGNPRATTVQTGVPDMGAIEVTPTSLPPMCTAVPATITAGSTQSFLFAGDTVCRITHDPFASTPSSLVVRQYTGTRPPFTNPSDLSFNMYIDVVAPSGSYNFNLDLKYKDSWIGTNISETDTRLAMRVPFSPWIALSGTASYMDTVNNTVSAVFLNDYGNFTGTDGMTPLPVELSSFNGYALEQDAVLLWKTASEINSKAFEVERMFNGEKFAKIGSIKAAGNSNTPQSYAFQDREVFANQTTAYYRLKIVDLDGSFEYSKIVKVGIEKDAVTITAAPNPFKNQFTVSNLQPNQSIEVLDAQGKVVFEQTNGKEVAQKINLPANLGQGLYIVRVSLNNEVQVIKMIKE
jgi:trimeric autotransporter adhesin